MSVQLHTPDTPSRFTPKETSPSTHWTDGWMGPRAGLDIMKNS